MLGLDSAVSISGMGLVSAAGVGATPLWESVIHERTLIHGGRASISPVTEERLRKQFPGNLSRPALFAWASASMAMGEAGWTHLCPEDGLILATTVGQVPLWEDALADFAAGTLDRESFKQAFENQPLGSLTTRLADLLQFKGRTMLLASACSASTQALGMAASWVRTGRVRRCLVGGVEVLSKLTLEGFGSLQLLSPEPALPFDERRAGINLSEAASFFCLEAGGEPIARLSGHGFTTDAFHMASPHPEGKGSFQAMKLALERAGLCPSDISFIHAHGTGSKANDAAEGMAISRLFGTEAWTSSTKWVHGHALGASGALETAICIEAIRRGMIPRTPGLERPDSSIRVRHAEKSFNARVLHVLKNTLGFGGNNAALVISAAGVR